MQATAIDNASITYEKHALEAHRISMLLPAGWDDMPQTLVEANFRLEKKPDVIKSSADGLAFVTLTFINKPLKNMQVCAAARAVSYVLESVYPFVASAKIELAHRSDQPSHCAWFSFDMPSFEVRNVTMFVTPVRGRLLLASCACAHGDDTTRDILIECLRSIAEM